MRNLLFLPRSYFTFLILACSLHVQGALKKVSTSGEFQSTLDSANPGDTIQLAPAVFQGEFVASRNGTESSPIKIIGNENSTIASKGNTGITIKGNYWKLEKIKITKPSVGVLVEGTGNSLESLVFQTLSKGILLKGPGNTVKFCIISDADGGIYVEADRNELHYNSLNIQTPSIIVAENTCCGLLHTNVANGTMELKGNGYKITNNVFWHGMYVTGCDNTFKGNIAHGVSFPKDCASHHQGWSSYIGLGQNDTVPLQPNQRQYPTFPTKFQFYNDK